MYEQIPHELRVLPQWVAVDMDVDPETGKPKKAPLNPKTGYGASINNPRDWGTFEQAASTGRHIGFVFTASDPYAFIDLDDPYDPAKNWTDEKRVKCADLNRSVLEAFDCYAEVSQSGRGVHLICRGTVPEGGKRDTVEVYSSGRYAIFTGRAIRTSPIKDQSELLLKLHAEIRKGQARSVELTQVDGNLDDEEIVERAMNAENGDKYNRLCCGEWQNDYPSQSEADFALLSIVAFYTPDNEQVRRLFRMTALGKREKHADDRRINYCLKKIRANEPIPVDLDNLLTIPEPEPAKTPRVDAPRIAGNAPAVAQKYDVQFPEGFIGDVADYIYSSAQRPVKEVALMGAISFAAGMAARAFNISQSGLNQYLVIMARTGRGKEGAADGIDRLVAAVRPKCPEIIEFQGPETFSSGQALMRVLDRKPCFFSLIGEFGITLHQLSDPKAPDHRIEFRKLLLRLFARSGWNKVQQQSAYADDEKDTNAIQAPNVTIFGETTPETLLEKLTIAHITQGLLSRFSILEYDGPRPPLNPRAGHMPSQRLVDNTSYLAAMGLYSAKNMTNTTIDLDPKASKLMLDFNEHLDALMNGSSTAAVEIELWNRAHLKALKLAGLLAVGIDPQKPVVNLTQAQWAIDFVNRDVHTILDKFATGEAGTGGNDVSAREAAIKKAITDWPTVQPDIRKGYGVPTKLLTDNAVVPYCYLRRRLRGLSTFRDDPKGATVALTDTLADMCKAGVLQLIPPRQMQQRYESESPAYAIGRSW